MVAHLVLTFPTGGLLLLASVFSLRRAIGWEKLISSVGVGISALQLGLPLLQLSLMSLGFKA
ncbi:hypothetical protein A1D31_39315 [Bradyrhizobium liaoningense]|nr:hypothetical protein A1D31_39315 [Bradyrhizobium liaoningense]